MSVRDHTTDRASTPARQKTRAARWWCETCGDDLPPVRDGRYPRFCGIPCAEWAKEDAKRRCAPEYPDLRRIRAAIHDLRKKVQP